MMQGEEDRADHGDEQDHAGGLKEVDITGVEHEADRLGIRNGCRYRRRDRLGDARPNRPGAHDEQQFGEENAADQHADRKILQRALLELGEIDVKHHDDEQEKYRDRADIDDDQDHREEFGANHHEQTGRVDERQNEKKNRMYRVSRSDHHHGAGHADAGKEIEKQRRDDHARV